MNGLASALLIRSDAERAIQRWEEWMALREQARENYLKSGSTLPLPKALADDPPPRPEPYVEEEMTDVSVDITANGFDASESFTLDRSMADDIVPASDPGMDRPVVSDSSSSCLSSCRLRLQPASPVGLGINGPQPPPAGGASPSSQSPHMRPSSRSGCHARSSGGMRRCYSGRSEADLQNHRSLEDAAPAAPPPSNDN